MKFQPYFQVSLLTSVALAQQKRIEHGVLGYGIDALNPACAFACRESISGARLTCSEIGASSADEVSTSTKCYASDDAFLQTLAWCMQSRCKNVSNWKLEKFWNENVAGSYKTQPQPRYTYEQALEKISSPPTAVFNMTGSLNATSVVFEDLWSANYDTDTDFMYRETLQELYGLVILLSGAIIPIAFSLLRFVPFPGSWRIRVNALIIDPPLFGTKHDRSVFFGLVRIPKRGQALFIFYLILINIVFSAVNHEYITPNSWHPGNKERWMAVMISNRIGLLSFANLPLLFLYAGRNNILLWITDWSHSTFLLLHRWVAAIATVQATLHSVIYLYDYSKRGKHNAEAKKPYWYWGIIATLGMLLLFPTSALPVRRLLYEVFLAWHVSISILIVAACYWHIVFRFQHQWGYETWIYVCMAIWGFDRVFRILRLLQFGVKTAEITTIDDEYVRITVPGISASGHVYLYFPTLTWRVWENHPFSIASHLLQPLSSSFAWSATESDLDREKQPIQSSAPLHELSSSTTIHSPPKSGITFYVRTGKGLTKHLCGRTSVPILIEAGYSSHSPIAEPLHKSPTLIAIAGGVGITAVLPHLRTHPGYSKLYWGCRTPALIDDLKSTGALSGIEHELLVGKRLAIVEILEKELVEDAKGEVCVLVSGPAAMIDEVRNTVVDIVKRKSGIAVRLEVEAFSW